MLKPEEYLPKNPLIVDDMDDYYKMQEEWLCYLRVYKQ
jgi:hypothetical protein